MTKERRCIRGVIIGVPGNMADGSLFDFRLSVLPSLALSYTLNCIFAFAFNALTGDFALLLYYCRGQAGRHLGGCTKKDG